MGRGETKEWRKGEEIWKFFKSSSVEREIWVVLSIWSKSLNTVLFYIYLKVILVFNHLSTYTNLRKYEFRYLKIKGKGIKNLSTKQNKLFFCIFIQKYRSSLAETLEWHNLKESWSTKWSSTQAGMGRETNRKTLNLPKQTEGCWGVRGVGRG